MMHSTDIVLFAVGLLLAKHCVADFFIQTPYQYQNKGRYLHPGGLLHAAIHAVMSAVVFVLLPPPTWAFAGLLLAGEAIIHYHVDFLKERLTRLNGWKTDRPQYWQAMGLDQFAHGVTYLGMVGLLARFGGV